MPHSNNLVAKDVEDILERTAKQILTVISRAQEEYQDLLEAYTYAGGTADAFAKILYNTSTPTAEQLAFVNDAIAAGQAIDAINTAVSTNAPALRRFS